MKTYLLPPDLTYYKANLHCHTTFSDGHKTPAEVKEIYQSLGYSVLAITDHEVLIPHDEITDDKFLCLHGVEMDVGEEDERPFKLKKSCHIGCIALDKDNVIQPCYNREKYVYGDAIQYRHLVKFDESLPDYIREVTPAGISDIMTTAAQKGFFVTYNHPTWNMQIYPEYSNFYGMHAMEICNGGCFVNGYETSDPKVYDDLLRQNRRLFCIAADDNHNSRSLGENKCDAGVAFTMIAAPKLEYNTITSALVKGNFYASQGPTISDFWFEDGKIHISCSDAAAVRCNYGVRRVEMVYAEKGEVLNEAEFTFLPDDFYFRITVIDKEGKKAFTNGYFAEDLFK